MGFLSWLFGAGARWVAGEIAEEAYEAWQKRDRHTRLSSSCLESAEWEGEDEILTITFRNGGSYWVYGADVDVYEGLDRSWSPGSYYHSRIKGHYELYRS